MRKNTKQKILNASLVLFSKYGYDAVSTRKISAGAEITEGAIYRHFDSKREILDEIFKKYKRKMNEYDIDITTLDEYVKTDTPKEFLKRAVLNYSEEDEYFIAHASSIIYRESIVNNIPDDISIHKIYENTALRFKYMLDLLVERKSIKKIDTQTFSLLWAQSMFSCSAIYNSAVISSESDILHIEENYYRVTDFLIDLAISGSLEGK